MNLVIFEDFQTEHFAPLCNLRGVFELRCGAITRCAHSFISILLAPRKKWDQFVAYVGHLI